MRCWRRTSVSRALVFAILLWTAIDLSNSSLCALDNEGAASSTVATPATAGAAVLDGGSSSSVPPAQSPHIDDCFCCSHCVEVAGLAPAHAATIAGSLKMPLVLAVPRLFGSPLYHPPLA